MIENQPTTPNMIIINIYWDRYDYNEEEIKKLNQPSDYGLYQIYGRHSAYGKDALLYIGQSNSQTFSNRLKERWEFTESCAYPHTMRIGRIVKSNKDSDKF